MAPWSAESLEGRDEVPHPAPSSQVGGERPPWRPLGTHRYDSPPRLQAFDDVLHRARRAHYVVSEGEECRVRGHRNLSVFDRRVDQRDVLPTALFNKRASPSELFGALLDADYPPLGAHTSFEIRKAEASAASHVQNCLAQLQGELGDALLAEVDEFAEYFLPAGIIGWSLSGPIVNRSGAPLAVFL